MKELEGKLVYLLPNGNNARRSKKGECIEALIAKVNRVNILVTLDPEGKHPRDIKVKRGYTKHHIEDGSNSGYRIFETMKDFDDHILKGELIDKIVGNAKYHREWQAFSLDKIRQIAVIMELL